MPLYEYRCDGCGNKFEQIRPIGDHITHCPTCGESVQRVYCGTFIFRFRGRNWKPYSVEGSEGAETVREERAYVTQD